MNAEARCLLHLEEMEQAHRAALDGYDKAWKEFGSTMKTPMKVGSPESPRPWFSVDGGDRGQYISIRAQGNVLLSAQEALLLRDWLNKLFPPEVVA